MFRNKFLLFAVILGLTFSFFGCGQGHAQRFGKAHDFELQDSEGLRVRLSEYSDKVIILNFFATWCPPCRVEIPEFNLFHAANPGIEVIGIMLGARSIQDAKQAKESMNIKYPVLIDDGKVSAAYGPIRYIPTTVIIDKDFNIVDKHVGSLTRARLEEKVKGLL